MPYVLRLLINTFISSDTSSELIKDFREALSTLRPFPVCHNHKYIQSNWHSQRPMVLFYPITLQGHRGTTYVFAHNPFPPFPVLDPRDQLTGGLFA